MNLESIYETGKVIRYHANPQLNIYRQTDADHAWGCVALLILLHPNPSKSLLCATIFHDAGERWAGDVPYPFKVANPKVAEAHAQTEKQLAREHGVPQYKLTEEEEKWLKFVDRLEALMYCRLHSKSLYMREDWQKNNEMVYELAKKLGVDLEKVSDDFKNRNDSTSTNNTNSNGFMGWLRSVRRR